MAELSPKERPTEYGTAVIGIVAAFTAYQSDHNIAALAAIVGAFLPTVITTIVVAVRGH